MSVGLVAQHPAPPALAAAGTSTQAEVAAPIVEDFRPPDPPAWVPAPPPAEDPAGLAIPDLGIDGSLESLDLRPDRTLALPEDPDRAGWYERSAKPGGAGPMVVVGHLTWEGAPAVFFRLAELTPGDRISVTRTDGAVVDYVVTHAERVDKDHFPTEAVYGPSQTSALRLITCAGDYDAADASYADNVIVYAEAAGQRSA